MTAMTHAIERFADGAHHPTLTAVLVVGFWGVAAVLVATAHLELELFLPPAGSAMAATGAVFAAAYGYSHFAARQAGVSHALGVGAAWLLLSIITEMVVTSRLGHGWFALLGTPARPLLRNLSLFVWIFAPAFFARTEETR